VVSSLHSDSSLSCPSSSGLRKSGGPEGSEADSERDSVSPQRQRDEVRKTKNIEQKEGIYKEGIPGSVLPSTITDYPRSFEECFRPIFVQGSEVVSVSYSIVCPTAVSTLAALTKITVGDIATCERISLQIFFLYKLEFELLQFLSRDESRK
jgi:hypothetical protein